MKHPMDVKTNWKLEPITKVQVFGPSDGDERKTLVLDALVDTGFSGWMSTSIDVILSLGLEKVGEDPVSVADARTTIAGVYRGYAFVNGIFHAVDVYEMGKEETIVGTEFLRGKQVVFRFWPGGSGTIEDGWDLMPPNIKEMFRGFFPHLAP